MTITNLLSLVRQRETDGRSKATLEKRHEQVIADNVAKGNFRKYSISMIANPLSLKRRGDLVCVRSEDSLRLFDIRWKKQLWAIEENFNGSKLLMGDSGRIAIITDELVRFFFNGKVTATIPLEIPLTHSRLFNGNLFGISRKFLPFECTSIKAWNTEGILLYHIAVEIYFDSQLKMKANHNFLIIYGLKEIAFTKFQLNREMPTRIPAHSMDGEIQDVFLNDHIAFIAISAKEKRKVISFNLENKKIETLDETNLSIWQLSFHDGKLSYLSKSNPQTFSLVDLDAKGQKRERQIECSDDTYLAKFKNENQLLNVCWTDLNENSTIEQYDSVSLTKKRRISYTASEAFGAPSSQSGINLFPLEQGDNELSLTIENFNP